jgi:hypothetical protein
MTAESIRDSILMVCGTLDRNPPSGSPVTRFGRVANLVERRWYKAMTLAIITIRALRCGWLAVEPSRDIRMVPGPLLRDIGDKLLQNLHCRV